MNVLRGLLFDNLGLKLVALLMAILVYLNVYTDRPATLMVSFQIQITDLADTLTLTGPAPAAVTAELRGTAKQLIRLRVAEPPVKISLAGVGTGRYERALGVADLPLPAGVELQVDRMVSPRTLSLEVDLKVKRRVPVAVRVHGEPAGGFMWSGGVRIEPGTVEVTGPAEVVAALDSVRLLPVALGGRRDTVLAMLRPHALPSWCTMTPEMVTIELPVEPAVTRRIVLRVEPPRNASGFAVTPDRVTAVVIAPRSALGPEALSGLRAHWREPGPLAQQVGRRIAVRRGGMVPSGARVRLEPDSVTLRRLKS